GSWVPRSTTACAASASSTVSRSATPRWSNATTTLIDPTPSPSSRANAARPPPRPCAPRARHRTAFGQSRDALQESGRARDDVVEVEAELLQDGRPRGGRTESLDRDRVTAIADPLLPALGDTRLDREAGADLGRQHLV